MTLADLSVGDSARVSAVRLAGAERRRLLDLGLVPGTRVECQLRSPLGDPVLYAFRGVQVALRRPQAMQVEVTEWVASR